MLFLPITLPIALAHYHFYHHEKAPWTTLARINDRVKVFRSAPVRLRSRMYFRPHPSVGFVKIRDFLNPFVWLWQYVRPGSVRVPYEVEGQRPMYAYCEGLTARPWWCVDDHPRVKEWVEAMEGSFEAVRREFESTSDYSCGPFNIGKIPSSKGGDERTELCTPKWDTFRLFTLGKKREENCRRVPVTTALLESLPDAALAPSLIGAAGFSVLDPGTHIQPHNGETNLRVRFQLALMTPEPEASNLRVQDEARSWEEGRVLVFDDAFEHEVLHRGRQKRVVLIADMWHPDLTSAETLWLKRLTDSGKTVLF